MTGNMLMLDTCQGKGQSISGDICSICGDKCKVVMQISAVRLQIFCVKTELRLKIYTASQKMWLLKHVDIKKIGEDEGQSLESLSADLLSKSQDSVNKTRYDLKHYGCVLHQKQKVCCLTAWS